MQKFWFKTFYRSIDLFFPKFSFFVLRSQESSKARKFITLRWEQNFLSKSLRRKLIEIQTLHYELCMITSFVCSEDSLVNQKAFPFERSEEFTESSKKSSTFSNLRSPIAEKVWWNAEKWHFHWCGAFTQHHSAEVSHWNRPLGSIRNFHWVHWEAFSIGNFYIAKLYLALHCQPFQET